VEAISVDAIVLAGKSFCVVVVVVEGVTSDVLSRTVCMVVMVDIWCVVVPTTEGVVTILLGTGGSREIDVVDGLTIVVEVINTTEVSTGRESDGAIASWPGNITESNEADDGRLLPCSAACDSSVSIVAEAAIVTIVGMYILCVTFVFVVLCPQDGRAR
jgi:hypothetical protein